MTKPQPFGTRPKGTHGAGQGPGQGPGLHGPASGTSHKPITADNQPAPEAKSAGHEVRAAHRARLAAKLDKVEKVYDAALADPDPRVGLVAARQISVELWGQPTQPVTGEGGGPLTVVLRRFVEDVPPE